MYISSKNGKLFKFIYLLRLHFPTSNLFFAVFFILKFIGVLVSTHNIKNLEDFSSNKVTIVSILEKILVLNSSCKAISFQYQILSLIIFAILIILIVGFILIFLQIHIVFSKVNDVYEKYLTNFTTKKSYKVHGKIFSILFILIVFLSQHIIEYLTFGLIFPFYSKSFRISPQKYNSNVIANVAKMINQNFINEWFIASINFISVIIIIALVFIFMMLNNTKSLFLNYGKSLYANISVISFLSIIFQFQAVYSIQNIFLDSDKHRYRLYINYIAVLFNTIFIIGNVKRFSHYGNFIPKLNLYLAIWAWYSGIIELPIYYLCDREFTQSYSLLKMINENMFALLILIIILSNNIKFFTTQFSLHLFQPSTKNVSIGEIYVYIELLHKFIAHPQEHYFSLNSIIKNHKNGCQNANCPCSLLNHFDIRHKDKAATIPSNVNSAITFLTKDDFIIICEQEIINRIYLLYKRKTSVYELSSYCVLHVQYVLYIKRHYYYALYLTNQYLNSKVKLDFLSKYYLYELKKYIMKELYDMKDRRDHNKKNLFNNGNAIVDNIIIKDLKMFYSHILFIETIKKQMIGCCASLEKIFDYKNEINKTARTSFSSEKFDFFISECEDIMIKNKKLISLLLKYVKRDCLNDNEICYYLYHFYNLIFKSIPSEIKGKFKEIRTYKSMLTNIDNSLFKYDLSYPMIIRLEQDDNFSICYINTILCEKLNYSKAKITNSDFSVLLPNELNENHKIIMKQFLFIPNPTFQRNETYLVNFEKHLINTTINVKVLPHFNAAFYLISNVEPIERYSDYSFSYCLLLNRDFKFLSLSENFETQFFFTLKMFDILKITFCDFFGISSTRLRKKLRERSTPSNNTNAIKEVNKAISIFSNINQEKMFTYRYFPKEISKLFSKRNTFSETLNKRQILVGLSTLVKTIDEIGLDIEWYGRVRCLKERLRLSSTSSSAIPQSPNSLCDGSFEVSYCSRELGGNRYYISTLIEYIDVKEITLSTMNLRESMMNKYEYQNKRSIQKMFSSDKKRVALIKKSSNWLGEHREIDMSDTLSQISKKSMKTSSQFVDSTNNVNGLQNSSIINQSTMSKINLIKSPTNFKSESAKKVGMLKKKEGVKENNNILKLLVDDKGYFINEKKREEYFQRMDNFNKLYINCINLIFIGSIVVIIINYIFKQINMNIHKDLFHINAYAEMIKTDIYLSGLVTVNICRELSFENTDIAQFFRIETQNENLNYHFSMFQFYISKFTGDKKLNKFFNILHNVDSYTVIKQNWEVSQRESTLIEEINLFHYYSKQASLLSQSTCRMKSVFIEEQYKNITPNEEGPNLLEQIVFYVLYNLLANLKEKFEELLYESVTILIDYYKSFWIYVLTMNMINVTLSLFLFYFIYKKISNDQNYIKIILSYIYLKNSEEERLKMKISIFKDILIGIKGKTVLIFDQTVHQSEATSKKQIPVMTSSMHAATKSSRTVTQTNNTTSTRPMNTTTVSALTQTTQVQYTNEHLNNSSPKMFNISKWIISISLIIYVLLLSVNVIITNMGKEEFVYSILIAMNFLEKVPKLAEMFIFAQQSVIINNISVIDNADDKKYHSEYLNYYNVIMNISDNSQLNMINESFFSSLFIESQINGENIKKFVKDKSKRELKQVKIWENKLNEKENFCINSAIGTIYSENDNKSYLEVFTLINKNVEACKVLIPEINSYGLESEIELYYQELLNMYTDFALTENRNSNDIIMFLSSALILRMTNNFEVSFKYIYRIYSHFLLLDLQSLYDRESVNEKMFSFVVFFIIIGIYVYVIIGIIKKNEYIKKLLIFFSDIIFNTIVNSKKQSINSLDNLV